MIEIAVSESAWHALIVVASLVLIGVLAITGHGEYINVLIGSLFAGGLGMAFRRNGTNTNNDTNPPQPPSS